jgi:hypothetical protein
LNAEIDRNNFYFEKTFDPSIGISNYKIAVGNLQEGQRHVITASRKIVDAINDFVTRYKQCPPAMEKGVYGLP